MQARKSLFIFTHRQFLRLWLGQVTSQAGNKVYLMALAWWILTTTPEHGGFALGAFMVAGALPSLMFCGFIGRVVDRMPPGKMLVACDLTSTALLVALGWALRSGNLTLEFAYLAGFALATVESFFNPAVTKCLPTLVPEDSLEHAVAYQASTQYLASFGGSVLGAVLISWLGIPLLVSLTAVNYFISAMIELTIDFPASSDDVLVDSAESESENTDQTPAQELDWHKFPLLRLLLAGFGLVNFFATPILVVIPLYVQKSLHAEADILGWLEASLWIGILLGTFAAAIIKTDGRTIRMGAVSMVIYGLCLFIPGLFINFYAFALALFGAGVSLGVNNVKFVTLFQKVVPNEVKGRFFAAMQAIISFSFPVAYLIFGYLGDILPPDQVCLIQGCGILLVAAWFYHLSRRESELHS